MERVGAMNIHHPTIQGS